MPGGLDMIFRGILAATAVAASIAMAPTTADAKTNVHIGVGVGVPGFYDPYPHRRYYDDYYRRPIYRIGCRAGANIVRDHGYRRVHVRDCGGRTYSYVGWKRGIRFIVYVNARNGVIVDRHPI
jgi:hypothetical protein